MRDAAVVARALGVPAPPESVRALRDQLRMFRPELAGTPAARDAARYLLVRPPRPLAARPMYGVIAAAAVALLPRWARRPLMLPYFPVVEAVAVPVPDDADGYRVVVFVEDGEHRLPRLESGKPDRQELGRRARGQRH